MKQLIDKKVIVVFKQRKSVITEYITNYLIRFSKADKYTIITYDKNKETKDIAVVTDADITKEFLEELSNYECVIMPYSEKYKKVLDTRIFGYSLTDDRANITAKNVNTSEDYISFEILTTNEIGRIKLNKKTELTVENILALAGLMVVCGTDMPDVVKYINSF